MSGGGARVSIPASVRRMIQNIKEIARHHSDEDVYAMLKECAMDPNETAQKLLLQDTFHEVKRKRDKRKENLKEHADLRWRQGAQGHGGRGGHGNYPLRHLTNGGVEGKNILSRKENGVYQGPDKGNNSPTNVAASIDNKSTTSISSKSETLSSTQRPLSQISDGRITSMEEFSTTETGVHLAAADSVLVPSLNAHSSGKVGDIEDTTQSQGATVEVAVNKVTSPSISGSELSSLNAEASAEMSTLHVHGEIQVKSQGSVANQLPGSSQVVSLSSYRSQTGSRPSSNYGNRSQQLVGSQKAVPNREWKPKSTSVNPVQTSDLTDDIEAPMLVGSVSQTPSVPASRSVDQEEANSNLEKKLDGLQLSARQHVIIPNHLQVPDSERHGLSFGSFDASFNFKMGLANGHMSDAGAALLSGSSHDTEETVEQPTSSLHTPPVAAPGADYPGQPKSSNQVPENDSSREAAIPGIPPMEEHELTKEEFVATQEDAKCQTIQPSNPTQVLGGQFSSIGNSEPQTHNTTQVPNIVVQQPLDPSASYYTQLYRPTADADGRLSPFLATGVSTKYSDNVATVPTQTNQPQQENGNFSNAASTSLTTQAAGSVQSSMTVPQQPVPVYRQPAAVHLPHYPIQYSQYFPMFYVPPTIHPFLSGAAFPQQPPVGSMYPSPGAAAAAPPVKFSLPQYKPGTDIGNSALIGTAAAYGTYTSMPAGYSSNPILGSGNSTGNEDPNPTQFRENNLYSSEQQSESSGIWIPAHGRDISSLQPSSFYSVPPQGQHLTFAPTQAAHNSAFGGIYHPAPAVAATAVHPLMQQSQGAAGAAEIAATPPPAAAYQQPQQHAQINWTNNY